MSVVHTTESREPTLCVDYNEVVLEQTETERQKTPAVHGKFCVNKEARRIESLPPLTPSKTPSTFRVENCCYRAPRLLPPCISGLFVAHHFISRYLHGGSA